MTFTADYDEASLKEAKLALDSDSFAYTVSGLEEPEIVKPLDLVTVDFAGTSPNLRASLDTSAVPDDVNYYINIEMSKREGIRNGDVITLTLTGDANALAMGGYAMDEATKEITVEGYPEILSSVDGVDLTQLVAAYQTAVVDKADKMTMQQDWPFTDVYYRTSLVWEANYTIKPVQAYFIFDENGDLDSWHAANDLVVIYQADVNGTLLENNYNYSRDDDLKAGDTSKISQFIVVSSQNLLLKDGQLYRNDIAIESTTSSLPTAIKDATSVSDDYTIREVDASKFAVDNAQ